MPQLIIAAVIAALIIIWFVLTNVMIESVSHIAEYKDLPDELDGKRLLLLTDLHDKCFSRDNDRLLNFVIRQNPDIVLLGGDMHGEGKKDQTFYRFAKKLAKHYAVYSVEGNHEPPDNDDWRDRHIEYVKRLESCGVVNLRHDSVKVFDGNATLYGNAFYNKCDFDFGNGFNILLTHDPNVFDTLEKKPDLMLSGHIHGGFIEIPFVGGLFAPGMGASLLSRFSRKCLFPKYYKGMYKKGGSRLVVSRGLGNSVLPFRLIMPETVCVTLKKMTK